MLPDLLTLKPSEARSLCRFCLRPPISGQTLQPPIEKSVDALAANGDAIRSWPDSEMGLLYAQLTGGEKLHTVAGIADGDACSIPPLSDGWCSKCPKRMRKAVDALQTFRRANTFWENYTLNWSNGQRTKLVIDDNIELERTEISRKQVDGLQLDTANIVDTVTDAIPNHQLYHQNCNKPHRKRRTAQSTPPTAANPPKPVVKKSAGKICHICGGHFACHMERHMRTAHRELTCDICGRTFDNMVPLRRHFREQHGAMRYTCDVCQLPNLTRSIWQRHHDRHRPDAPRPFACDQCGNTYTVKSSLVHHLAVAHVYDERTCAECGKVFQNAFRLRSHAIRHQPKGLTCPEAGCGQMFWLTKDMNEHVRSVHRKLRRYACAECGKRFLTNTQLKKHAAGGRCAGGGGGVVVAEDQATPTTVASGGDGCVDGGGYDGGLEQLDHRIRQNPQLHRQDPSPLSSLWSAMLHRR